MLNDDDALNAQLDLFHQKTFRIRLEAADLNRIRSADDPRIAAILATIRAAGAEREACFNAICDLLEEKAAKEAEAADAAQRLLVDLIQRLRASSELVHRIAQEKRRLAGETPRSAAQAEPRATTTN